MLDALIVGAGPTGLAMTAELLRWGLNVRLIDKAAVPPADASRALAIQARTLEIFHMLGTIDAVRSKSIAAHGLNIVGQGNDRTRLALRALQQLDTPYPEIRLLAQSETEAILQERLKNLRGHAERGVELQTYLQEGDKVAAVLRSTRGEERVEARWLIGCDGSRSAVREQAGIAFEGETYDDHCMVGDVFLDWSLPDQELYIFPSRAGIAVAFPMPEPKRYRTVAILPSAPADRRELSLDEFMLPMRDLIPVPFTVTRSHFLSRYRLHHRVAAHFRHQRAFIAGDAAHVHSPVGGQGMNTGIQDAFNLGWKLALVCRGQAPESILDTYETERRPVAQHLINFTDRGFTLLGSNGAASKVLRTVAPQLASQALRLNMLQKRLVGFVSQLHIRYHASAMVSEVASSRGRMPHPFSTGPKAGARAPDFEVQGNNTTLRLLDLLRDPSYVLVLFTGELSDATDPRSLVALAADMTAAYPNVLRSVVIARKPSGEKDVYQDVSGNAHKRYGASEPCAYLIRPDGYIGFRGQSVARLALQTELAKRLVGQVRSAVKAS